MGSVNFDFTLQYPGDDDPEGGKLEMCPVCGRAARIQRDAPVRGKYPAYCIHRVKEGVDGQRVCEGCRTDDALRADGLAHNEVALLRGWIDQVEGQLRLLRAATNIGWYQAMPPDGHDTLYYLNAVADQMRQLEQQLVFLRGWQR